MKISTVGTKGRTAACAHGCVPADIHPILLLQQVQPAILAGGAQQQPSSQVKNGESICQEQKLQLLIGPVSFDLLTHFFQREDLEGLCGKSMTGRGGCKDITVWWPSLSRYKYGEKNQSLSMWSSPKPLARKDECRIITPYYLATMLGQG